MHVRLHSPHAEDRPPSAGGGSLAAGVPIAGSPLCVTVVGGTLCAERSSLRDKPPSAVVATGVAVAGEPFTVVIEGRDVFGNRCRVSAADAVEVFARGLGSRDGECTVATLAPDRPSPAGTETAGTLVLRSAGRAMLSARGRGAALANCPCFLAVKPAAASAAMCLIQPPAGAPLGTLPGEAVAASIKYKV